MKLFVNSALNDTLKAELRQQLPTDPATGPITVVFRHDLPADQQQAEFQSAGLVLGNPPAVTFWVILGYALLLVAAGLTLWSMAHYLLAAWPHLRESSEQK